MIDLIIPVYNESESHMLRLLGSIISQENSEEIEITLVDDYSDSKEYLKAVDKFKTLLKINILNMDKNCGPGVARQYGLDHTSNDFIVFADSDDEFLRTDSFKILLGSMEKDGKLCSMCVANFYEEVVTSIKEVKEKILKPHPKNLVWTFGKMYRREFLDKYEVRFHETSRTNEDMGFNRLVSIYSEEDNYPMVEVDVPVYLWKFNINSITRKQEGTYGHSDDENGSYYGFLQNRSYVIRHAMQHTPNNPKILLEIADTFFYGCTSYIEEATDYPQYREKRYEYLRDFYIEFIKPNENSLTIKNKIDDMMKIDTIRRKYNKMKILEYTPSSLLEILEKSIAN